MSTQQKRIIAAPFAPHTGAQTQAQDLLPTNPAIAEPGVESRTATSPRPGEADITRITAPIRNPKSKIQNSAPQAPAIQSLAAELHQAAIQGLFQYPGNLAAAAKAAAVLLVGFSLLHLTLVTVPLVNSPGSLLAALVSWRLVGAILGVVVALVVADLLANLFPSIQVTPQGLGVSGLLGWRRIPWKQLGVLRVMPLSSKGRYVVMIPFQGALRPPFPAPMLRIVPVLAGAAKMNERGVPITSDIKNFERLLQLVVSYMAQESGQTTPAVEAFVDEQVIMPLSQLALDSQAALARMARAEENLLDPYGVPAADNELDLPWSRVARRQLLIAAAPALMLLVDTMLRHNEKAITWQPFAWAAALLVIGFLELPFVAKLVQSIGEVILGSGKFKKTLWAYLELQVPRVGIVVVATALLGVGVPPFVALCLWLGAIIYTTVLSTRFVAKLYFITTGQALMATIGVFIYQAAVFALYVGAR